MRLRPFPNKALQGAPFLAESLESATVSARIIRADGTIEDLGVVAHGQRCARRGCRRIVEHGYCRRHRLLHPLASKG